MITREVLVEGQPLPLLQSAIIPPSFAHGFSTRAGGVSAPPFDSLNMGARWGDPRENVLTNRRRMTAAVGAERLWLVSQVHGAAVTSVAEDDSQDEVATRAADALTSDRPGQALGIFTADCVPLLLADARTGACGAVHAGWRGVVAGVVPATVATLADRYGSRAGDLCVAAGPAIGPCCFEVGPEVVAAFEAAITGLRAAGAIVEAAGRRPHLDLKRALALQLTAAGVTRIDLGAECTHCDPARFYSYRRDNTRTGQHLALIVAPVRSL